MVIATMLSSKNKAIVRLKSVAPIVEKATNSELKKLVDFLGNSKRLLVISGAGLSTTSGLPDYRSPGRPEHKPMKHQEYVGAYSFRQRYWARSLAGYQRLALATPNKAHDAVTALEKMGILLLNLTQNVDGLQQRSGATKINELHGNIHSVKCLDCSNEMTRETFQKKLATLNEDFLKEIADKMAEEADRPDGDLNLDIEQYSSFHVPACSECTGILKPNVVFFGGSVPKEKIEMALNAVDDCDSVLVLGSSLQVYSGFRYVRGAKLQNKPVAVINIGPTRADDIIDLKIERSVTDILPQALQQLATRQI